MTRRQTRGEAHLQALLAELPPGSERHNVLSAARDFKASWVLLGERLTEVRERELYKEWSFPSFEAYCRQELRLKAETANKLTRSFAFVRDHSPGALSSESPRELPPLDVVDLLSRARERSRVSDDELHSITHDVFEGDDAPSRQGVLKRFREHDPDAFRPAPKPARTPGDDDLRKALLISERLQSLVEPHDEISGGVKAALRKLTSELRDLFEASRQAMS